ncbi:MAG: hypothetical protein MJ252_03160 [archaeon]|nr:hypothetical protein [archaeon]
MGQGPTGKENGKVPQYLICPECSRKIPKFRLFVENSIAKLSIFCECNEIRNYSGVMMMGEYLTKIDNIDTSVFNCTTHNKPETKYCINCEKWLCEKCAKKDHCLQKFEKNPKMEEIKCKIHKLNASYYCLKCKKFLCESCKSQHNEDVRDESNAHELVSYASLLNKKWLDEKQEIFLKICDMSKLYKEQELMSLKDFWEKAIHSTKNNEEIKKYQQLLRTLENKSELNNEACKNIEGFYFRLMNGLYISKDKILCLVKENTIYNLLVNSSFTDKIVKEIEQRMDFMKNSQEKLSQDVKFLEEYTLKYIEYLSSSFLMFTLKNDLFRVSPPIKTISDISAMCIIDQNKVAVGIEAVINVYNLQKQTSQCTFKGHTNEVTTLFKFDPKTLISASLDNTIKVWNLEKRNLISTINVDAVVANIFKSAEGDNILNVAYYFSKFSRVALEDKKTLKVISQRPVGNSENFEVFDQLESGAIICGSRNNIAIYNEKTIEIIKNYTSFDGSPLCFCELENESIAAGMNKGYIIIFDYRGNDIRLNGHKDGVTGLQVLHGHNDIMLSTSLDCSVKFWNLKTNTCQETFTFESKEISYFNKLDNGTMLIAFDREFAAWQGYSYNNDINN